MLLRLAVFLITLSGLTFEIGLTRIYSATIWYHFTFVAVSVALLGWGLGGLTLHVIKRRLRPSMEKAGALRGLRTRDSGVPLDDRPAPGDARPPAAVLRRSAQPFLLAGMALSMISDLRRHMATSLYFGTFSEHPSARCP
jgi:hypothetical protein